jgi:phosphatidylserine decarboxylase
MTLLFKESPLIAAVSVGSIILAAYNKVDYRIQGILILLFLMLLYFYRYKEFVPDNVTDNMILSPCEGKVIKICQKAPTHTYISIFLSPLNRHTQIYPVNGVVIKREYDLTGRFNIVMNINKSRKNEKKIHYITMVDGTIIKVTQLAGLLPRMIVSDDTVPMNVYAGQYMGMMKFGSRVDMLVPTTNISGKKLLLNIKEEQNIKIGELLGEYAAV